MLSISTIAQPYLQQTFFRVKRRIVERALHHLGASRSEIQNIQRRKQIFKGQK